MREIQFTVAETSLAAYIALSAGAIFSVWPTMQQPILSTMVHISEEVKFMLNPGMDSSLSKVPPKTKDLHQH